MPKTDASLSERFWAKVEKTDECWLWTGSRKKTGLPYGFFKTSTGTRTTHRISWEMHYGPIPEGLCVCHRCDNASCVNPDHLYLGTQADNLRDASQKGRISNHRAKLNEDDVHEIRRRYKTDGPGVLATRFGITPEHAWRVFHRKTWRNL